MTKRSGFLLVAISVAFVGLIGCSEYGNAVARDLAMRGTQQAVVSGVRNEIEGPRGTTVNVSSQVRPAGTPATEWYIDEDLILGDEISDEAKSIYSVIIQDAHIGSSATTADISRMRYVELAEKMDFKVSPDEFREAYQKHVDAWRRGSQAEVHSTWAEVTRIALKYGVRER